MQPTVALHLFRSSWNVALHLLQQPWTSTTAHRSLAHRESSFAPLPVKPESCYLPAIVDFHDSTPLLCTTGTLLCTSSSRSGGLNLITGNDLSPRMGLMFDFVCQIRPDQFWFLQRLYVWLERCFAPLAGPDGNMGLCSVRMHMDIPVYLVVCFDSSCFYLAICLFGFCANIFLCPWTKGFQPSNNSEQLV